MSTQFVVTIGEILVEIMATEPGAGFLAPTPLIGPFPSGAPAIFIDQCGKVGQPCGMIGCVGRDDFGKVNLDRLRADGVDVSAIRVHPELVTGSAFVRYRPDGGRDFVFNIKHSASGAIELDAPAQAMIARATHLHVMGSSLSSPAIIRANLEAIRSIRAGGGTVSFDPNIRKEMLDLPGLRQALGDVLSQCDLFMPSGSELFLFAQAQEEGAAAQEILGRGVRALVLKRGALGARYYDHDGMVDVAGFAVEEIDPTGAGDCFGAAFVSTWLSGARPVEALRIANAAGALAVTRRGPMEGAATLAEIKSFLGRQGAGAAA
jgi:sugar/nucleoside kinase (ribokinase family)